MVSFFADKVETMVGEHAAFAPPGSAGAARVAEVQQKAKQSSQQEQQRKNSRDEDMALETLVVNEAEAEAEEEAEEEAQQEEQKMSAFSRDDEQANPWRTDQLANIKAAGVVSGAGEPTA